MADVRRNSDDDEREGLISSPSAERDDTEASEEDDHTNAAQTEDRAFGIDHKSDWRAKIKLLVYSFAGSAVYVRKKHLCYERLKLTTNARPLCPTSSRIFMTFQSLVWPLPTTGCGLSIHLQRMSAKALLWDQQRLSICCLAASSAGGSSHLWLSRKDGLQDP